MSNKSTGINLLIRYSPGLVFVLYAVLTTTFLATGISGGDSGDLVTAAATFGVPHPPGYPLYTFLGWILSQIPVSTVAWRVGLLSALPQAVSLSLVYQLTKRLSGSFIAAWFATIFLGGNYLFFHYSVTPEVFGLFSLFVSLIMAVLFSHLQFPRISTLVWLSFIFGLSLTHHQVILFLVPAGIYVLRKSHLQAKVLTNKKWLQIATVFAAGLLPYLYVVFAAWGQSMIIWNNPRSLAGFIRLVTRADYGTFLSTALYGGTVYQRLLGLEAYGRFLWMDLTPIGIVFAIVGFWAIWQRSRRWFWTACIAFFCIGPGFIFYASFPLIGRFGLGTYERFLLPSYVILTPIIGVGFSIICRLLVLSCSRIVKTTSMRPVLVFLVTAVLFLPTITTMGITLWRFWGLSQDQTVNMLGRDMLSPLPTGSIFLVSRDTPLFVAQYVHFVEKVRPDIRLIHMTRIGFADYRTLLIQHYPELMMPNSNNDSDPLAQFAIANAANKPVFAMYTFAVGSGWAWVPYGLTHKLTRESNLPRVPALIAQNDTIWSGLHDPTGGILSRYDHLMLSDVRNVYTQARIEYGQMLLRADKPKEAADQFSKAVSLGGDTMIAEAYTYLGISQLFSHKCEAALAAFGEARQVSLAPSDELWFYEATTYKDCLKNEAKAREIMDVYLARKKSQETPIK